VSFLYFFLYCRTNILFHFLFFILKKASYFSENAEAKPEKSVSRESSPIVACTVLDDKSEDSMCFICHEKFEMFFDNNAEEWMYKDAVRINNIVFFIIIFFPFFFFFKKKI